MAARAARGHGRGTSGVSEVALSATVDTPALCPFLWVPHVKFHGTVMSRGRWSPQWRRGAHGLSRHTRPGLTHDAVSMEYTRGAPEVIRPARPRGLQVLAVMREATRCPHSLTFGSSSGVARILQAEQRQITERSKRTRKCTYSVRLPGLRPPMSEGMQRTRAQSLECLGGQTKTSVEKDAAWCSFRGISCRGRDCTAKT